MRGEKIAVFMKDVTNDVSSVVKMTVIVFEIGHEGWKEKERCYVTLARDLELADIRGEFQKLISWLGDCRIAAGDCMLGVLYKELNEHGFSIFEISDCGPDTLDGILCDIEATRQEMAESQIPTKPMETETPGVYFLDLIQLQQSHPELTSKQVLHDFFDTVPFYELELICAHLPPWIETGPYEIEKRTTSTEMCVCIRNKKCQS